MGAKNKQRSRRKGDKKVTFNHEELDMEAGSSEGVENGETVAGRGQSKPSDGGEEFNLDEVLRLGGTQVGTAGHLTDSCDSGLPGSHGSCLLLRS